MKESNAMPDKKITRKDLISVFWRCNFLQASFNYERFQNIGWAYTMIPILKKIYTTKESMASALKSYLEFFNTHPVLITPIAGIIAAMEERGEDPESIRGVKVALMGPLGGIGDAIVWLTFLPIFAGIGVSLSMQGNIAGPIIFLILFNIVNFGLKYWGIFFGYNSGLSLLKSLSVSVQSISKAASTIGILVIGSLIPSYVRLSIPYTITAGQAKVNLQTDFLDKIMPGILPLGVTLLILYLMRKKNFNTTTAIIFIIVIGILGSYTGLLG
ncbi:PTS system mannose/fructose/sorbose family transporter subunit IID [Tepidanaerobacter syntrophicus]|uniref:PTS system, N-acetylgalactosamine-specific IID component n=1 Tax=Tepidanaerobacter syntrophicus TaxID=224999 RepID=A0A0U9HH35_9FIRM|nr:PTS system mannose/fructose/sorbose family transporter subunit IID [Tepidanaerobacter syntrophicus]GAQ26013.1 PTS system, N-acetylgalactosamine-specific IID component [Tepidanaerobacter syntrophicus]GLI19665.1 PTS N-acetylgalactosamine transporter subunit IID [Tepidanaerobacter syntrophicus]